MNDEGAPSARAHEAVAHWQRELAKGGYEHRCPDRAALEALRRPGRTWRRILRRTAPPPGARVYEIGCGGGRQLARLALSGYEVRGIDVSADVVARARAFLGEVAALTPVSWSVEVADALSWEGPGDGALCFEFGVSEHFLEDADRLLLRRRMRSALAPGGWLVAVVPAGRHPLRARQRREGLGGYVVPEIDYDARSLRDELLAAGLEDVSVWPANPLGWLAWHPSPWRRRLLPDPLLRIAGAALALLPLSLTWGERLGATLVAVGRRGVADADTR